MKLSSVLYERAFADCVLGRHKFFHAFELSLVGTKYFFVTADIGRSSRSFGFVINRIGVIEMERV